MHTTMFEHVGIPTIGYYAFPVTIGGNGDNVWVLATPSESQTAQVLADIEAGVVPPMPPTPPDPNEVLLAELTLAQLEQEVLLEQQDAMQAELALMAMQNEQTLIEVDTLLAEVVLALFNLDALSAGV